MKQNSTFLVLCVWLLTSCTPATAPAPAPSFPTEASKQPSVISRLRSEPVTAFDLGMTRLQSDFFQDRDYRIAWFRREHPGVEFTLDQAMFWPIKEQIMIHRNIYAPATLANCVLAIETLRDNLLIAGDDADDFARKYFWHYRQEPPTWLMQLPNSIVLVGDVFDPNAEQNGGQPTIYCESGLPDKDVRVLEKMRSYQ